MANTTSQKTTQKTSAKSTTTTRRTPTKTKINSTPIKEDVVESSTTEKKLVPTDIDPSQYVPVRSGFHGTLVYVSSRTGETFLWDEFGAEQEMELRELRNAKSSHKQFFANNWFMFDDDWIVDYLGVRQFYKNAIPIDEFDGIFSMGADELESTLSSMSDGQKRSVVYRAKELIADKKIDSLSVISALENTLGIVLVER